MLVKDLLILFQACNEGVINVLGTLNGTFGHFCLSHHPTEHYFEMSHVDASQALSLYRQFCKQTERVVEYLGVAKKLQNLLNVPIPNLKHVRRQVSLCVKSDALSQAPVSLAGALEEYLKDPNFEQNRIEYKTNKEIAERTARTGSKLKPEEKTKSTSGSVGSFFYY